MNLTSTIDSTPARPRRAVPKVRRLPAEMVAVIGILAIFGYIGALTWAVRRYSYDYWGPLLFIPVLFIISIPWLRHIARTEPDPRIVRLIAAALVLKLLIAPVRYSVTATLYGGVGDAHGYHLIGAQLAPLFRRGVFVGWQGKVPGTGFIEILTGAIYSVTGATELGGYVVFSWIGFWGLYWFYRAFRRAIPDGNYWRYALLVFLLPSLLFWPSSIGKEAWMTLGLGLSAYGIADLFTRGTRGLPWLMLGLTATTLARPHLTLLLVSALGFGYLIRPARGKTVLAPLSKIIGAGLLVLLVLLSLSQAKKYFQLDQASTSGTITQALDTAQTRTAKGGSQFSASAVSNPATFPQAVMTVIYRPYFFEARNGQALIASLDGTLLLVLTIMSWRGFLNAFTRLRSQPYLAFVVAYVVLFIIAFSRFANFGILARERVQVIPLFLALLCVPARRRDKDISTADTRADGLVRA